MKFSKTAGENNEKFKNSEFVKNLRILFFTGISIGALLFTPAQAISHFHFHFPHTRHTHSNSLWKTFRKFYRLVTPSHSHYKNNELNQKKSGGNFTQYKLKY